MIALWWFLSLSVAFLLGWICCAGIARANAASRPLPDAPLSFPLSVEKKKELVEVVSLDAHRLRRAGR